jgi:hypothetical protein
MVAVSAEAAWLQQGSKQCIDSICSAVLAMAARWQHQQSGRGSAAVARQRQAARRRRWQHEGGGGSAAVGVTVAAAAQWWQAARKQGDRAAETAVAERWQRRQHGDSGSSRVAASDVR